MTELVLAGVVIALATGGAVSLLMFLPCSALAESAAKAAAWRGRVWLAALILPVGVGGVAALWTARTVRAESPLVYEAFHREKHLCFEPLLTGPDAGWRARVVGWIGMGLVAVAAARMLGGVVQTERSRRLRRRAARPPSAETLSAFERVPPALRLPEGRIAQIDLPERNSVCAGVLRPEVFVTMGLVEALSRDELAAVLAHECAHARRHDNLVELIAKSCALLLGFVPSAIYFARRWARDSELAADEAALKAAGAAEALVGAMAAAAGTRDSASAAKAPALVVAVGGGEFAAERVVRLHAELQPQAEAEAIPTAVRWAAAVISVGAAAGLTFAIWDVLLASLRCLGRSLLGALG